MNRRRKVSQARLSARRRLLILATGLGVWATGALWLVFHYFVTRPGAFGPEHSPLEPWWLKLHGAFAFLSLWIGGLLWGLHIVHGWRMNRRRWTGSVVLGAILVLIATGYLLYYAGDEDLRPVLSAAHWILGLGLPLAYLAHRLVEALKGEAGD